MSLSDKAERAAQACPVLRSGKLENRLAQVRFARQAEGLGLDLVADLRSSIIRKFMPRLIRVRCERPPVYPHSPDAPE